MVSKNGEARQCANTNRASIENNRVGNIDMNIVAKSDLNFQGKALVPVSNITGVWLTSADLAKDLNYKSSKSITNLFNQNADEFTAGMSQVIESVTTGNYRKKVRVFSLRGAHLIAMFARTDVAKEFRRWVLDILDRESANSPIGKQFTDEELSTLCWMWKNSVRMISHIADIEPLLRVAEHRLAPAYYSMAREYCRTTNEARRMLQRETSHIHCDTRTNDNWRVLKEMRIDNRFL